MCEGVKGWIERTWAEKAGIREQGAGDDGNVEGWYSGNFVQSIQVTIRRTPSNGEYGV